MTESHRMPKILILGSGIAGLTSALKFAENSQKVPVHVTLLSKMDASEGATRYAQGGIASVWSSEDSFESHKKDTFEAGAGLCDPEAVDLCVKKGPARVQELIAWGVEFTKLNLNSAEYDLHKEGGHQHRRILHSNDLTGFEIERALLEKVKTFSGKNSSGSKIDLVEDYCAIDLIKTKNQTAGQSRCVGAYALNTRNGKIVPFSADLTILASGGAGKVYLYSSNPSTSTGDGIAMAYRAGARVSNLEFIQFHPTCLFHPTERTFLITEALRGEGAVLKNLQNESFMEQHHPLGSLAPRDVVARAIDMEIKKSGARHVWLDCSAIPSEEITHKFPNIFQKLLSLGIDIRKNPIPVVPAAHYTCGGVKVDRHGQTSVPGLYAVGEVACTGLHGANRLASNSLLEAVVYSHEAAEHAVEFLKDLPSLKKPPAALPEWKVGHAVQLEEQIDITATWYEVRSVMWNFVGIVRSNERLERARRRLQMLKEEVQHYYWKHLLTRELIELRNLVLVADLIIQSAQLRKESRGLHYNVDYPEKDDAFFLRETLL